MTSVTTDVSGEPFEGEPIIGEPFEAGEGRQEESGKREEGKVAKTIEEQTSKLPSDTFLYLAGGSIIASLILKVTKRDEASLFVGQWAPTFLLLGVYNKIVKTMGHDKSDR